MGTYQENDGARNSVPARIRIAGAKYSLQASIPDVWPDVSLAGRGFSCHRICFPAHRDGPKGRGRMGKEKVQRVQVHTLPARDGTALRGQVCDWQVRVMTRKLQEAELTGDERRRVLEDMLARLTPGRSQPGPGQHS